ncbi:uncharacterized protein PHALS_11495 [Plasmopara halstedii]|uniref:Uncharacterized protein n=1 Tax=Plasmopara halstedii TaxID=4781 RepID=A0A0P1A538_PLAHL|nr:uncharacterized protein PHALS_11495 [Plasmopara halstedii]CEG35624.1 hypothetical protein PHALS_11495 [Plasmopara halstedii]|eukprot:XP_024571993.1 hypothetical protein PHALS_11495 [Plasmopara halstedii]
MGNLSGNSGLLLAPPHFLSRRSLDRFLAYYIAFNPSEAQHNTFIISHRELDPSDLQSDRKVDPQSFDELLQIYHSGVEQ